MPCCCICHVAPCCAACRLAELNPNVRILVHAGVLTKELVAGHDAVIFTQVL
jgi:hypothetical protein